MTNSFATVDVECCDASHIFARVVSAKKGIALFHQWARATGQPDLARVDSIAQAAATAGVDGFRKFVLQVSGGLWQAIEVAPETVSRGERALFERLQPPTDELLVLPFADFADDPLVRVLVEQDGAGGPGAGEWQECYEPPVAERRGTAWLANVVREGGWVGPKHRVSSVESLAEQLSDSVVFWYQFRYARVYSFPVRADSDLGAALIRDPQTVPTVVIFESELFGPKIKLLLGIQVDGELRPCGDMTRAGADEENRGPCFWGWSAPGQAPQHNSFEGEEIWCWR